jgi:asparagine synthase (glutamine-hydrolysing)
VCGIAGILALRPDGGDDRPLTAGDERVLAHLTGHLVHRGPDGRGRWSSADGRCALGHTRLQVIDPETGAQPMATPDGRVVVVYNGEIYNFRDLRARLEARGHAFRTRCDTEVLVHGYREWGEAVVERLDGMFAFGLWDVARQRLLLARDPVGQKPLYLATTANRLVFASEVEPLWDAVARYRGEPPTVDPAAVEAYLRQGFVPAPATGWQGLAKLPPATVVTVAADGRREERRYWRADWSPVPVSADRAAETTREILTRAVEKRLVADVPLGAFLSGGLDSTIVAALMARLADRPVRTFSVGFPGQPDYDETPFARMAADRLGTRHTVFDLQVDDVDFGLLAETLGHVGEPYADSSILPTWLLCRRTRQHVTVALSGDGGDELFAGYPRFLAARLAAPLPPAAWRPARDVARALPHRPDFRHPFRRVRRFLEGAAAPRERRLEAWLDFFVDPAGQILRPEVAAGHTGGVGPSGPPDREPPRERSALTRALAATFEGYLPDDLQVKADRAGMAHGLEVRAPFLDRRLVEFAATLPDGLRMRGARGKWLLRRAFDDVVPGEIAARGKRGFGLPLPHWLRGRWKGPAAALLTAPDARILEWVRPDAVRTLWAHHQEGREDHAHRLWCLLALESWLRRPRPATRP